MSNAEICQRIQKFNSNPERDQELIHRLIRLP